jgi:3-hydroxyacyl-CoA dehydrogenase/3a,7a,12a-trihydroxy-5b-cholest-24-enoyl-CoA hydratase
MAGELRFDGRVAVITGAGGGLGRAHALLLGSRGAKVVVNDLGGSARGDGKSSAAADSVVAEIKALGGQAVANHDSVEDGAKIVQCALDTFGRVDLVINNAGILRDVIFHKMTEQDWDLVYRVHVLGAFRVTHAAWPHLREQGSGKVLFTASAAGIYGNAGQANYSMAKLGLNGFARTLAVEGMKKNIQVNTIAPIAGSRMTETVMPKELVDALKPELVSPLVAWLCHDSCTETGSLFEVGGGVVNKLRWERTRGVAFKLGQKLTPEAVQDKFPQIISFEGASHPADLNDSLAPVMENLENKGKGGNEFIDVDAALGAKLPELQTSYNERDLAIYALGVGAARDPLDPSELQFVYELADGFRPLPTFAVTPAVNQVINAGANGSIAPGMNFGLDRVLHGEQLTELKRPWPTKGKLSHRARVKDIFDKGKNALIVVATDTYDEQGRDLAYNEMTIVVRGAGGWGGDRGPSGEVNAAPARAPDAVVTEKVAENQALLYRLSGDWNPLHADPAFATAFGFQKPILHGLCTFGFVGRHVVKSFAKGDSRLFKSIKVRFAESVYPGETLKTEMWKESDTRIVLRCTVVERNAVVISNAAVELWTEVPADKPVAAVAAPVAAPPVAAPVAAPAPAAGGAEPSTEQVFAVIGAYVKAHPELAGQIKNVFQFQITGPDSSWVVELKNGAGDVRPGVDKAECTLTLAQADFLAMCTGKADPQKLFMTKKLKITGNVMASQKLDFLRKLDASAFASAPGAAAAAPKAAEAAPAASRLPSLVEKLGRHFQANPQLASELGALLQFRVKDPDGSFVLDARTSPAKLQLGQVDAAATTTLTLTEADLAALVDGKAVARDLFMHGDLRVNGEVRPAHQLHLLKV